MGPGARDPCSRKPQHWGTGFRDTGQGLEGCTRSPTATWLPPSLLPFSASAVWSACPSAWGTIAPVAQCFPLTELLCLFWFFWRASSCWLPRVMLTAATLPFCTLSHFSFWTLFMLTTQIFLSHCHDTFDHRDYPALSPEASSLSSVQSLSCRTLCHSMDWSTPGFPVHHQLRELTQTHVHRIGDAIQPSHPLSPLFFLPSIFPSIRVFSNESVLHIRWPKYWSFSFNISPSNEYSELISFRMDWLDLLAVQGTLKSLLQCHSSKPLIL